MQIPSDMSDVQDRHAALCRYENHEIVRRFHVAQHLEVLPHQRLGRQRGVQQSLLLGLQPRDFHPVTLRFDLLFLRDLVVDRLYDLRGGWRSRRKNAVTWAIRNSAPPARGWVTSAESVSASMVLAICVRLAMSLM